MLRNQLQEQMYPLDWAAEDHWPPGESDLGDVTRREARSPAASRGGWAETVHSDNIVKFFY